ncbi:MAG: hypothetical protein Q8Q19_06910, partial [Microbacterium sp.]|nr:hypothetical protein [Microbacterium sp.]
MVDLAPGCGDRAPRDHTPAITDRDRPALQGIEDTTAGADRHDPTFVIEQDPLDTSRTPRLQCGREWDEITGMPDTRPPTTRRQICRSGRDGESGGGTAQVRE